MLRTLVAYFLLTACLAHADRLDSLLLELKKNQVTDTQRVNLLNSVAYEKYLVDLKSAQPYAQQALELAKKCEFLKGEVAAYLYLSYIAHGKGDNDAAFAYADSSVAVCEAAHNEYEKVKGLNQKGNIYGDLGDISSSLNYYLQASKLAERYHDNNTLLVAYGNIGISFMSNKQYAKSKEYLRKGIALADEMHDDKNKGNILNNLGGVYLDEEKYDSALICFTEGEVYFRKAHYDRGQGFSNYYLGYIYNHKQLYPEAIRYFEKAIAIFQRCGNDAELPNLYNCIAEVLLKQNKPDEALVYGEKSLSISKEQNLLNDVKEAYSVMKEVYEHKGDYKKALAFYTLYVKMKDSLFNSESTAQMAEMQTRYETTKKEDENRILLEKNESNSKVIRQQRYFAVAIGFICVLLIVFAVFLFRSSKNKHRINLELERKNATIARQKEMVEEKQKEVLDSIRYAKRIQGSLLTSEKYIARNIGRLKRS